MVSDNYRLAIKVKNKLLEDGTNNKGLGILVTQANMLDKLIKQLELDREKRQEKLMQLQYETNLNLNLTPISKDSCKDSYAQLFETITECDDSDSDSESDSDSDSDSDWDDDSDRDSDSNGDGEITFEFDDGGIEYLHSDDEFEDAIRNSYSEMDKDSGITLPASQ